MTTNNKFSVNAVRPAIIQRHNEGNKKAIDKRVCEDLGIVERMLEKWCEETMKLQMVIFPYVQEKMKPAATRDDEKCGELRAAILPKWEKLLEVGEEDGRHDLEATEHDVDSLVGFAETFIASDKGTLWSLQTATKFRKAVEAYLGCKIYPNVVLNHAERDLVRGYEGALATITNKTIELDGMDTKEGHKNGLRDDVKVIEADIVALQNQMTQQTAFMKDAKGDLLAFLENAVEGVKRQVKVKEAEKRVVEEDVKEAEKALKAAEEFVAKNKAAYEEFMGKLK